MEEVVEKHQFNIYKYCYQMVRSKETAEDITQEVFIRFYRLNNRESYSNSYLYSIAHSKCIDYLRSQKRRNMFIQNYQNKTQEASTEDHISRNQYSMELENALMNLTSYERSVLLLKGVNGFSYKDMAEILNKKEVALRKQFQRVRVKIEKNLRKEGVRGINEKVSVF